MAELYYAVKRRDIMDTQKKESFIMFSEHQELIEQLSDEQAGKLFKGIFEYSLTGEKPNFDSLTNIVFIAIRQDLDRNAQKYEAKVERLRQNACKGGRPKNKETDLEEKNQMVFHENQKNQMDILENQKNQIESVNDNVNVNVNDNVLSLYNGEKVKIEREEREILENYVRRKKLATKSVRAYVNRLVENGDYKEILESERNTGKESRSPDEKIQEQLASIHDKRSAAKVLVQYYASGGFPPFEFDEIADKYDLDSYDKIYEYAEELSNTE